LSHNPNPRGGEKKKGWCVECLSLELKPFHKGRPPGWGFFFLAQETAGKNSWCFFFSTFSKGGGGEQKTGGGGQGGTRRVFGGTLKPHRSQSCHRTVAVSKKKKMPDKMLHVNGRIRTKLGKRACKTTTPATSNG